MNNFSGRVLSYIYIYIYIYILDGWMDGWMDWWMDSWMDLGNQIWRFPPPNLIAAFLLGWHSIYGRLDGCRQSSLAASADKFDCGFHLCCILDILFVWTDGPPTDRPLSTTKQPLSTTKQPLSITKQPLSTTIHRYTTTISTIDHHYPRPDTTIWPLYTTIYEPTNPK